MPSKDKQTVVTPIPDMLKTPEAKAIAESQAMDTVARVKKDRVIVFGPQGKKVDVSHFLDVGFRLHDETLVLGAPETIILPEFRKPHGWKYAWPKRLDDKTSALINRGWYEPVLREHIDPTSLAAISEIKTSSGTFCVIGPHLLVAIHPEACYKMYDEPEQRSLVAVARRPLELIEEFTEAFGAGGYKAEVTLGDRRQER